MNKIALIWITVFILFIIPAASGAATNYYVANTARGDGTGLTDCTHAKIYTWDWSSTVNAGDTIYICGTIAPEPPYVLADKAFSIAKSGDVGNPITIKFCKDGEAGCGTGNTGKFTATYPPTYGFIWNYQASNIVIDGNGGIIEATDNGSDLTYQESSSIYGNGINIITASNVEIKNLTIQNLYQHTYQTTTNDNVAGKDANKAINLLSPTNVSIHDVTIKDCGAGVIVGSGAENLSVYNTTTSRVCWGFGSFGVGTVVNFQYYNNDLEITGNWNSLDGVDCHNDGLMLSDGLNNPALTWTNGFIFNNYIHGPFTDPASPGTGGAWVASGVHYMENAQWDNYVLFNNLFIAGPYASTAAPPTGVLGLQGTNIQIYNNTFISYQGAALSGLSTWNVGETQSPSKVYNNIFKDFNYGATGAPMRFVFDWVTPVCTQYHKPDTDYNINYNFSIWAAINDLVDAEHCDSNNSNNTSYTSLALWQAGLATDKETAACSGTAPNRTPADGDCNSYNADPLLNTLGTLISDSPAIGVGKNLTSVNTTGWPFPASAALLYSKPLIVGKDAPSIYGRPRPATGGWDIGAYSYGDGAPSLGGGTIGGGTVQ